MSTPEPKKKGGARNGRRPNLVQSVNPSFTGTSVLHVILPQASKKVRYSRCPGSLLLRKNWVNCGLRLQNVIGLKLPPAFILAKHVLVSRTLFTLHSCPVGHPGQLCSPFPFRIWSQLVHPLSPLALVRSPCLELLSQF